MTERQRITSTSSRDRRSRIVTVPADSFVFHEGELGTEMYVIHEGEVEIIRARDGDEAGRIAILEKGDFFGEMALLEHVPRNASARVRNQATLLRVDGAMFNDLIRAQPEIAVGIMRRLCQRIRAIEESLAEPATEVSDAKTRVERVGESVVVPDGVLRHHGSDTAFTLSFDEPVLIGRRDPITGVRPTVDLTPVDGDRSSSRQHGRIFRDGEGVYVMEELGATNGTYLNDQRLRTGTPVEVSSGDKIRFGLVTLELELR